LPLSYHAPMRPVSLVPTMFHRRLLLLFAAALLALATLAARLANLTLARGQELRAAAESKLVRFDWTPTTRGRVLDRHHRVHAVDDQLLEQLAVVDDLEVATELWVLVQQRVEAVRALRDDLLHAHPVERLDVRHREPTSVGVA